MVTSATCTNNPTILREILELLPMANKFPAICDTGSQKKNALHHACGILDGVDVLNVLSDYIPPDRMIPMLYQQDSNHHYPLHMMCFNGDVQKLSTLLKNLSPEQKRQVVMSYNTNGMPAYQLAVLCNSQKMLTYMLGLLPSKRQHELLLQPNQDRQQNCFHILAKKHENVNLLQYMLGILDENNLLIAQAISHQDINGMNLLHVSIEAKRSFGFITVLMSAVPIEYCPEIILRKTPKSVNAICSAMREIPNMKALKYMFSLLPEYTQKMAIVQTYGEEHNLLGLCIAEKFDPRVLRFLLSKLTTEKLAAACILHHDSEGNNLINLALLNGTDPQIIRELLSSLDWEAASEAIATCNYRGSNCIHTSLHRYKEALPVLLDFLTSKQFAAAVKLESKTRHTAMESAMTKITDPSLMKKFVYKLTAADRAEILLKTPTPRSNCIHNYIVNDVLNIEILALILDSIEDKQALGNVMAGVEKWGRETTVFCAVERGHTLPVIELLVRCLSKEQKKSIWKLKSLKGPTLESLAHERRRTDVIALFKDCEES